MKDVEISRGGPGQGGLFPAGALPLRAVAASFAAACVCAAWMGAYFGAELSGTAVMVACWLLFLGALTVNAPRREAVAGGVLGALFAAFRVIGTSYDALDSYGRIVKSGATLRTALLAWAGLALAASAAAVLLLALLRRLIPLAAREGEGDAYTRRRLFAGCAALIFAGSIPYLLLYAPGNNIYDTHDQLLQCFGYPSYIGDGSALTDHHPVLLTVLYGGFMKLGLLLGDANIGQMAYSLLSMAAIAACYAAALCVLYDAGLSSRAAAALGVCVALYPVLALYAFNMCKDVTVEPFVLLFAAQMIRLERSQGEAVRSRRFALAWFLNMLVIMAMRKSAMYALLFAAVATALRYRAVRRRIAALMLGAVALFFVGYTHLLLPALGVQPGETREALSIPFQQTARYLVTHGDDVTEEEMAAVAGVLDVEYAKEHYNPRLSDPVKDTSNPEMGAKELFAYARAWVSMGLRHPGVYLDAWLNMIYGYFYPSDSNTIVCLMLTSPNEGGMTLRHDPKLAQKRLALHDFIYYTLRRLPGVGALFYVDTVSWAFLFLLAALTVRGGVGACAPFAFFLGMLLISLFSPKSGEIRYLLPILYALPLMMGTALLPRQERAQENGREGMNGRHAKQGIHLKTISKTISKTTLKTNPKARQALSLLLSLALATAFALVFYRFNTPLGASIGSDNAMYLTLGTAVARGYRPYADVFDHKGPLLFVMQAIPQAIAGGYSTLAVFVMEVLSLFACLRVARRIALRLGAPSLLVQLAYLALTCPLADGGNLTEEYTGLFTLLGLLLALRAFGGERQLTSRELTWHAAGMGAMAALAMMLRANNALPLCAFTLGLAVYMVGRRAFAGLGRCALGFTLGLLAAVLPVALWLAAQGVLGDAFYGSILHNFLYAETGTASRMGMLLHNAYGHIALALAALSCAGALALRRRAPGLALALVAGAAGAGYAGFISHKFYTHYLMLGTPLAVMGLAALLGAAARRGVRLRRAAAVLCLAGVAASAWAGGVQAVVHGNEGYEDYAAFAADAQALYALVPPEDQDSFLAYRVEPRWYVATGALPCMRFYFLQEILAQADPAVMDEIVETFETDPPRWLVIYYNREFSPPYDPRVAAIFETEYEFVDARGAYQLKRLKERL